MTTKTRGADTEQTPIVRENGIKLEIRDSTLILHDLSHFEIMPKGSYL